MIAIANTSYEVMRATLQTETLLLQKCQSKVLTLEKYKIKP